MKTNTVRIRKQIYTRINKLAEVQDMPASELINRILRDWLITNSTDLRTHQAFEEVASEKQRS